MAQLKSTLVEGKLGIQDSLVGPKILLNNTDVSIISTLTSVTDSNKNSIPTAAAAKTFIDSLVENLL